MALCCKKGIWEKGSETSAGILRMQMQVPYTLYLDFRGFRIHFKSIGSSLMRFDPSLSSCPIIIHELHQPPLPHRACSWASAHLGTIKGCHLGVSLPSESGRTQNYSFAELIDQACVLNRYAYIWAAWGLGLGSFVAGLCSASLVVCSQRVSDRYRAKRILPLWLIFQDNLSFCSSPPS